jgi:hypothetical protein
MNLPTTHSAKQASSCNCKARQGKKSASEATSGPAVYGQHVWLTWIGDSISRSIAHVLPVMWSLFVVVASGRPAGGKWGAYTHLVGALTELNHWEIDRPASIDHTCAYRRFSSPELNLVQVTFSRTKIIYNYFEHTEHVSIFLLDTSSCFFYRVPNPNCKGGVL